MPPFFFSSLVNDSVKRFDKLEKVVVVVVGVVADIVYNIRYDTIYVFDTIYVSEIRIILFQFNGLVVYSHILYRAY